MKNNKCIWAADTDKFGMCAAGLAECTINCPLMQERRVKTNADRIRAMSDEELAELLGGFGLCEKCGFSVGWLCQPDRQDYSDSEKCVEGVKRWLKQPAEEEQHGL